MEERVSENSGIKFVNPEHSKVLKRFLELSGLKKEEQDGDISSVTKSDEESKSDESNN